MNKKLFITFGEGGRQIKAAAMRLQSQAIKLDYFDECIAYSGESLGNDYWSKFHEDWKLKRGYGYWAWKPYLILKTLEAKMADGDYLLYADAGCEINPLGKSQLDRYFEFAEENRGFFAFEQAYRHIEWCRKSVLDALPTLPETLQVSATVLIFRKCSAAPDLARDWWLTASAHHGELISDPLDLSLENANFREHRHDQALLQGLITRRGFSLYSPDESFQIPWHKNRHLPILAVRNKTGRSELARLIGKLPVRLFYSTLKIAQNIVRRIIREFRM